MPNRGVIPTFHHFALPFTLKKMMAETNLAETLYQTFILLSIEPLKLSFSSEACSKYAIDEVLCQGFSWRINQPSLFNSFSSSSSLFRTFSIALFKTLYPLWLQLWLPSPIVLIQGFLVSCKNKLIQTPFKISVNNN